MPSPDSLESVVVAGYSLQSKAKIVEYNLETKSITKEYASECNLRITKAPSTCGWIQTV